MKFTGKERDQDTKLDYFGARYLTANLGRWLSVDKVQDGWNLYEYVAGAPIVFRDLDGFQAERKNITFEIKFVYNPNEISKKSRERIKQVIKDSQDYLNETLEARGYDYQFKFKVQFYTQKEKEKGKWINFDRGISDYVLVKLEKGNAGSRSFMNITARIGTWYLVNYTSDKSKFTALHELFHGLFRIDTIIMNAISFTSLTIRK